MKRTPKDLKRYKDDTNSTSSGYLYLEAAKKVNVETKERSKRQQAHNAVQEKKRAAASTTQSNPASTPKERSAHPSASVPLTKQADALKSDDCVQSNKKLPTSVQDQPAKNKSFSAKKQSVASITEADTADQTAQLLDKNVDSSLPKSIPLYNKQSIDKDLISIVKPYSLESDLFKVLRGKILFPVTGKPPKSIMVTSAVPGEGKSFIASNLAINLAQNIAEYVLLADCDLRRPSIHRRFGFSQVKGLSDHLENGTRLSSLLLKTVVNKLTLLPAGQPPLNPSEILSSAKMGNLIDELKSRYDDRYLILDSPPPMLAPETTAIAKRVDGIIVVIKFGDTSYKMIEQMIDVLDKEKIIGAVLNQIDKQASSCYYGYRKYNKYYKRSYS